MTVHVFIAGDELFPVNGLEINPQDGDMYATVFISARVFVD